MRQVYLPISSKTDFNKISLVKFAFIAYSG